MAFAVMPRTAISKQGSCPLRLLQVKPRLCGTLTLCHYGFLRLPGLQQRTQTDTEACAVGQGHAVTLVSEPGSLVLSNLGSLVLNNPCS